MNHKRIIYMTVYKIKKRFIICNMNKNILLKNFQNMKIVNNKVSRTNINQQCGKIIQI